MSDTNETNKKKEKKGKFPWGLLAGILGTGMLVLWGVNSHRDMRDSLERLVRIEEKVGPIASIEKTATLIVVGQESDRAVGDLRHQIRGVEHKQVMDGLHTISDAQDRDGDKLIELVARAKEAKAASIDLQKELDRAAADRWQTRKLVRAEREARKAREARAVAPTPVVQHYRSESTTRIVRVR